MSHATMPRVRSACLILLLLSVAMQVMAAKKEPSDGGCPMRAPPIERKQLLAQPGVMAVTLSKDQLRAAVLLKDGYAIQIYHTGCEHVGFDATRWIDELPKTPALQLDAIRQLIHIGLQDPGLKNMALKQANFTVEKTDSHVYFKHKNEELEASFTHQANGRYLLSVSYALPY